MKRFVLLLTGLWTVVSAGASGVSPADSVRQAEERVDASYPE